MDAPAQDRRWDYRPRLEAFFRAASVPDASLIAERLSARFATLSELLSAEPAIVAEDAGWAAAGALRQARALMIHAADEELRQRRVIRAHDDAATFLKVLIGFRCDECLVVLFLDARRGLIDHEIVAVGRADAVEFDSRRILLRAIGRGASAIIVAHNHPSGDPRPSTSDLKITRQLADLARGLGICLDDHLVVAGGDVRSAMFVG